MSKVKNLPESTSLSPNDLVYVVDVSVGPNAGRKATIDTLKQAVIADASEIPYDNTNSTLAATDVRGAIDELDTKQNDHSARHDPNGVDALSTAAPVTADADGNNNIGSANAYSKSDHKHNVLVGTPISQAPDQTNNAGTASSLARSDHRHNIPTDAPTNSLSPATANAEGIGSSFARNDHTHEVATGLVGEVASIEPDDSASAGVVDKFARIDHKHPIAADVPIALSPDGGNSEGVSTSFSRADHKHDVPAAAPTTTLSPATTNAEGSGTSFSRNDHTHAVATGLVGELIAIQPDDTASAGTVDKFARIDHRHPIAADVPVNTGTANAEGNSTSFARANHVHNTIIANSIATATADDTTVSTTDVLIVGMTLTPAAGTYLATFSTSAVNSGNGASRMFFSIYSDGVKVAHSEREIGIAGGANQQVHTNAIVTVNGSQAIEARWSAVAGTNTAHERSLTLIRLG